MLITAGKAVPTSKQMTAHLLCTDCEGLLDKSGENWELSRLLREDGTFKPGARLKATRPHASNGKFEFYWAADIPQINVSAPAHLGAGIFWRGGLHPWNGGSSTPVRFDPYGEALRRYLLGESNFPTDLALHVLAREGGATTRMMAAPWGGRSGAARMYKIVLPGLAFVLHDGQSIGDKVRESCFVNGERHPMVVTGEVEHYLLNQAVQPLHAPRPKREPTR